MIRCLDQTRNKWRVHYITTLRNRLKLFNTKPGITDTLCTAITEWFDTCTVTISKYHPKYHSALQSQLQIGWRHIFTGKLSTEWQHLQGQTQSLNQQTREPEVWAASIVEISLRSMIELWKERNASVHAETNVQEQEFALHKLKDKVQNLIDKQQHCRPSDDYLFPENPTAFMATSQAPRLTRWLVTTQRAIKNSIIQATKEASSQTRNIQTWFQPTRKPNPQNPVLRKHDQLLYDPYSKKKRHKINRSLQTNRIDKYCLSLRKLT